MIEHDHEIFKRDLVTVWEIRILLSHGETKVSDSDIIDSLEAYGATNLGKVQKKVSGENHQERVWCLRNLEQYKGMASTKLYECWWNEHTKDFGSDEEEWDS